MRWSTLVRCAYSAVSTDWRIDLYRIDVATGEAAPIVQPVLAVLTGGPGNDLFFGFNQGWIHEADDLRFQTQDRKVSARLQYTFRF